jgi:hypothetical protein
MELIMIFSQSTEEPSQDLKGRGLERMKNKTTGVLPEG